MPLSTPESQLLFQALIDGSDEPAWAVRADDFRLLCFNKAFVRFSTRFFESAPAVGMRPCDLAADTAETSKWLAMYGRALTDTDFELRLQADRLETPLLLRFRAVCHADKPLAVVVSGRSVLTQMSRELELAARRLQHAEQAAGIGVWEWDIANDQVSWSPQNALLYGVAPNAIRTYDDWLACLHPDDRAMFSVEALGSMPTDVMLAAEFRIILPSGEQRRILSQSRIVPDHHGRPDRVVGTNIDVTDARRTEEELRFLTEAMDRIGDAVSVTSTDGTILYANRLFEALFAFPPGKAAGASVFPLRSPRETNPATSIEVIVAALRTEGIWRGELLNRRLDGQDFPVRISITTHHHRRHGEVWIATVVDISAWRELQAERDRALQELRWLSDRLADQVESLRTDLAHAVHDELGSALTGIRMQIDALAGCPGEEFARRHAALTTDVTAAMQRCRDICTGLRPAILDDLGLVETVRWYARQWRQSQTGISLTTRLEKLPREPSPELRTDLFRITQELLTNVVRHATAGHVTLSLRPRRQGIEIAVRDDGRGLAPDYRPGFGHLGLRERIHRHGGSVAIESRGTGTEVVVRVPLETGP